MLSLNSKRFLIAPLALLLTLSAAGCRIEREQAGEAPEVDVDVEPGQLPEYEVEGPDVNVGTEEETITVPEVNVEQREETVDVPTIDVEPPGADPDQ